MSLLPPLPKPLGARLEETLTGEDILGMAKSRFVDVARGQAGNFPHPF